MMIAVVVIFAICWLPQHVYFVVQNLEPSIICYRHIQHAYLIIFWFAMSNSMYNPIMYCWMNARQATAAVYCVITDGAEKTDRLGIRQHFLCSPCVKDRINKI